MKGVGWVIDIVVIASLTKLATPCVNPRLLSPMRICSVEPSSTSGRGTLDASSLARSANLTAVAAWSGSGTRRLAATM